MKDCHPVADMLDNILERAREAIAARGWHKPDPVSAAAEAQRRVQAAAESLQGFGIPQKIAWLIARDELADSRALWHVRKFVESDSREVLVLVLSGQKDGSKTTAACQAIATWPRNRRPEHWPRFITFDQLLGPWYHRPTELSSRDELTQMTQRDLLVADLLVLDDVGQEAAELQERCGEALDLLLKARCDAGRHTVLTTNDLTLEDFVRRYGARGARLNERLIEFSRWAKCPHEGFRTRERRRAALANRPQEK